MTTEQELIDRIEEFKNGTRGSLEVFQQFEQGCPPRLRVNIYKGCTFNCKFCYIGQKARPNRKILTHLLHDMKLATSMGLGRLPVMVSCSSDPFQPWEARARHTEKVLRRLAEHSYQLIIMTQNPAVLLESRYLDSLMQVPSIVEVTVPSLSAGPGDEGIFNCLAPPAESRIEAMESLKQKGIPIRLRLAPLIPRLDQNGPGQSEEEIWRIVEQAHNIGVQMVISNVLMLTPAIDMRIWRQLGEYYSHNGLWTEKNIQPECNTYTLILQRKFVERILKPVYEACREFTVPFCPCASQDCFPEGIRCVL